MELIFFLNNGVNSKVKIPVVEIIEIIYKENLMISNLFYRFAFLEVLARWILAKFPNLKDKIKKYKNKKAKKRSLFNEEQWDAYKQLVSNSVEDNSIVLVHASMDGLNNIGVDEDMVFDFLSSFIDRGITVVSTAYPVTNRIKNKKMKPYNPEKTPCWTGMLSNKFASNPLSIRSVIPYNSLAAIGSSAKEMMEDNIDAEYVYGEHTPWRYCVINHARILFIGTTCLDSNTIQTHMIADYMGDRWPINNWYDIYDTPLKINGELINHKLKIQSNFWTQYVVEYATTRKIKEQGLLKEFLINGCPFGYITDSYDMVKYLEAECEKGKLMYMIPKKYWKKDWRKNG